MNMLNKQVSVLTPKKIFDEISKTIVGQTKAKRVISNAMYLHLVKLLDFSVEKETNPNAIMKNKSNVLLMGPSGCGKTYLVRTAVQAIRDLVGIEIFPLLEIDSTGVTAKGWKGDDIDEIIGDFYKNKLGGNKELFSTAIIYMDEFDKMAIPAIGTGGTDHNKTAQYSLLKLVEGKDVETKGEGAFATSDIINTSNVLFIFAGNFLDVRSKRKDTGSKLGFTHNNLHEAIVNHHEALIETGVVTELVGRIGYTAELEQLTKEELVQILVTHVVPDTERLLHLVGIDLQSKITEFEKIAENAIKRGTGARGLDVELLSALEEEIFNSSFNL